MTGSTDPDCERGRGEQFPLSPPTGKSERWLVIKGMKTENTSDLPLREVKENIWGETFGARWEGIPRPNDYWSQRLECIQMRWDQTVVNVEAIREAIEDGRVEPYDSHNRPGYSNRNHYMALMAHKLGLTPVESLWWPHRNNVRSGEEDLTVTHYYFADSGGRALTGSCYGIEEYGGKMSEYRA